MIDTSNLHIDNSSLALEGDLIFLEAETGKISKKLCNLMRESLKHFYKIVSLYRNSCLSPHPASFPENQKTFLPYSYMSSHESLSVFHRYYILTLESITQTLPRKKAELPGDGWQDSRLFFKDRKVIFGKGQVNSALFARNRRPRSTGKKNLSSILHVKRTQFLVLVQTSYPRIPKCEKFHVNQE